MLDLSPELPDQRGVAGADLDADPPGAELRQRGELHRDQARVAAGGGDSDHADLEPLGLAKIDGARDDGIVKADVLVRPDAVDPEPVGRAHRRQRRGDRGNAHERDADPHNRFLPRAFYRLGYGLGTAGAGRQPPERTLEIPLARSSSRSGRESLSAIARSAARQSP